MRGMSYTSSFFLAPLLSCTAQERSKEALGFDVRLRSTFLLLRSTASKTRSLRSLKQFDAKRSTSSRRVLRLSLPNEPELIEDENNEKKRDRL